MLSNRTIHSANTNISYLTICLLRNRTSNSYSIQECILYYICTSEAALFYIDTLYFRCHYYPIQTSAGGLPALSIFSLFIMNELSCIPSNNLFCLQVHPLQDCLFVTPCISDFPRFLYNYALRTFLILLFLYFFFFVDTPTFSQNGGCAWSSVGGKLGPKTQQGG